MNDPISPLASVNLRQLCRTELNFILRAIADVQHMLVVTNGQRFTESDVGEMVEEETSTRIDYREFIAALDLVQRLLGATGQTPEHLDAQVGIRAAIEATGDAEALRLYERWRDLTNLTRIDR